VHWRTDRALSLAALVVLAAACAGPTPSDPAGRSAGDTPESVPPTSSADASAGPGQPYTGAEILDAMRSSPRPDGVPDELQTDAIAAAIADAIWTFDGEAWNEIVIGGTCAADSCLVEVSGSRDGADADDVWVFAVVPAGGDVAVESTALGAIPTSSVEGLDELARSLLDGAALDGMLLTATTWVPPPGGDEFTLSYRSGGEEGSCGADVVIDAVRRELVDERRIGDC
jgi:hypothetical protein